MLGMLLIVLMGFNSMAQDKPKEDQIRIKIIREIDGERQVFERTYASEEEMESDEELKAFQEEDGEDEFFFSQKGILSKPKGPGSRHHYAFDLDQDAEGDFFIFKGDSLDSMIHRIEIQARKLASRAYDLEREHFLMGMDDMRPPMIWTYPDSMDVNADVKIWRREMDRMHRSDKRIRVTDDEATEFGFKAKIKNNDQLELKELEFFPNPSDNGRISMRLMSEDEGILKLKIYDLQGEVIYARTVGDFDGRFSESIDLSGQKPGSYLLEIALNNKRLNKKLLVN